MDLDVICEDLEVLEGNIALELDVEVHEAEKFGDVEDASIENEDVVFVKLLEKYGKILLQKIQTPVVKIKKREAIQNISKQLSERGYQYSEIQIKKKIENMKSRLKLKVDRKRTGNVPIVLKHAEKLLMEILDGTDNPSISRLQFGTIIGVDDQPSTSFKAQKNASSSHTLSSNSSNNSSYFEGAFPKKTLCSVVKTGKENGNSNKAEMQNTIFEEQMEVFRMQTELYSVQTEYYRKKLKLLDEKYKENEK